MSILRNKSLLSKEELALFNKLHDSRVLASTLLKTRAFKGFWKSVVEKYPEKAHFVYELLQNADDAEATEAEMILGETELIFKHNGKVHFTISDEEDESVKFGHINSITAVGNSEKIDDISNKIGKFGVGFKAVFVYTNAPEIYDDIFQFKITSYIVPSLLENDHPLRKKGETLFVFPFANKEQAYNDIEERLNLLKHPILFLHNLRKFTWSYAKDKNRQFVYEKEETSKMTWNDLSCDLVDIKDGKEKCKILMTTKNLTIKGSGSHQLCVGFFIKEDGAIDTEIRPKVHCFFPTSETFDQCFISHAPFELTDSRQQLKSYSQVNKILVDELASMAANSLIFLRDYNLHYKQRLLTENLFSIVPLRKTYFYTNSDSLFSKDRFYDAYRNVINTHKLILTKSGEYACACDTIACKPQTLATLLKKDMLVGLQFSEESDFVSPGINKLYSKDYNVEAYLDGLKLKCLTSESFGKKISQSFMEKRDSKWIERFYKFLMKDARSLWRLSDNDYETEQVFRTAPIIKIQNGAWVPPFLQNGDSYVYLPFSKGSKTGYNIVDKEYTKNETFKQFLEELGIKKPSQEDYIKRVLLAKHARVDYEFSVAELVDDLDVVYSHYITLNQNERNSLIESVFGKIRLHDTNNYVVSCDKIYDTTDPNFKLFVISQSQHNLFNFLTYKPLFEKHGKDEIMSFLYRIGVKNKLFISKIYKQGWSEIYSYKSSLNESQRIKLSFPTTTDKDVTDYNIDGLREIFISKKISLEISRYIWNCLAAYGNMSLYRYLIFNYYYRTNKRAVCDSSLYQLLKYTPWLDGKTPSETSMEVLRLKGFSVSKTLCEFLGIREKELTLSDLGASKEQIAREQLGAVASELGYTNAAELRAALEQLRYAQEAAKKAENTSKQTNSANESASQNREELKREDIDDMFTDEPSTSTKSTKKNSKPKDKNYQDALDKLNEKFQKEEEKRDLRAELENYDEYTFGWFNTLLELEYRGSNEEIEKYNASGLEISFSNIEPESDSNRIYVLSNPSRNIPMWIEEQSDIQICYQFFNKEEIKFRIDVANVRDYILRIKVKESDIETMSSLDWKKCTKATISISKCMDLVGNLKKVFAELPYDPDDDLRDELDYNLKFIFGPPGTGKTTTIAKKIQNIIEENSSVSILVLAPTNKACDVIAKRIFELTHGECPWLARFVNTGDEFLEEKGIRIERDNEKYLQDQSCIISTIARLPFDGFNGVSGNMPLKEIEWDYVIIDEASMIPVADITYAILKFPDSEIIVSGGSTPITTNCERTRMG